MTRHIDPEFGRYDSVLFLALWWRGARSSYTLTDIIWVCDRIDRSTPSAEELDSGLNRLLAAGLVREDRGRLSLPVRVRREFNAFRRRRRRDRFVMAEAFVQSAGPLKAVPRRVTVRRTDHQKAWDEYHRRFQAALKKVAPSLVPE